MTRPILPDLQIFSPKLEIDPCKLEYPVRLCRRQSLIDIKALGLLAMDICTLGLLIANHNTQRQKISTTSSTQ